MCCIGPRENNSPISPSGTGLRVSELVKLKVSDVNLDVGFIKCKGKGSKERIVPLGGAASRFLEKYLREARDKLLSKKKEF